MRLHLIHNLTQICLVSSIRIIMADTVSIFRSTTVFLVNNIMPAVRHALTDRHRRVERRTGEGGVLMAETFKVGANARELLRYTQRATRIVTDDISRSDARKIIQKVAALEDVRDIQKVCGTAVHALDTRDREGFSKSTFRLYGEGIRLTARQILLDAHAANNVNFQTDYDKRVEKIGAVVDGCSLLLEYLTICTEEGIISAKKAGIWTKKVTDVKYPAMKWLTSERGRAEKLRAEAERKRLTEQAAALKAVLYPEP